MIIDSLIPYESLDDKFTHGIRVRIDEAKHDATNITTLREIIRGYPGKQELRLTIRLRAGDIVHLKTNHQRVNITEEMRRRIEDCLGPGSYRLMMSRPS